MYPCFVEKALLHSHTWCGTQLERRAHPKSSAHHGLLICFLRPYFRLTCSEEDGGGKQGLKHRRLDSALARDVGAAAGAICIVGNAPQPAPVGRFFFYSVSLTALQQLS